MRTGWAGLRTIHALLVYLQKSPSEERPVVAVVLLLLDMSDESSECSLYREEVLDAITAALSRESCSQKIQEQSARCLLMLGERFSINGESAMEQWLLERSGFQDSTDSALHGNDVVIVTDKLLNEEEAKARRWKIKAALVLLNSGRRKFLHALLSPMENDIPVLSRACLVTVSWLSGFLNIADEKSLQMEACSIFFLQLLKSLKFNRDLEESLSNSRTPKSSKKHRMFLDVVPIKRRHQDTTAEPLLGGMGGQGVVIPGKHGIEESVALSSLTYDECVRGKCDGYLLLKL